MNRSRLGLLSVLVVFLISAFGARMEAQECARQVAAGVKGITPDCSTDTSYRRSTSSAQQKIDEINRSNSAAQDVLKNQMDRLREALTNHAASGNETDSESDLSDASEPVASDEPYISDVVDKELSAAPVDFGRLKVEGDAASLLRQSRDLLQNTDCAALMSTYRPGPARTLPPECMTAAEAMSVYTPMGRSQPTAPSVPEPVIDGSQIPSIIDFTLGPSPSQSSESISPSLQRLANKIQKDDLPSQPAAEPSPSVPQSNSGSFQLSEPQEVSVTGTAESLPASAEGQNRASESDSGGTGVIDRIFDAGKNAREGLRNLQIQVGDRLRGITRDADGAPVKIGSKQDTKKNSIQDEFNKKIDELLDQ